MKNKLVIGALVGVGIYIWLTLRKKDDVIESAMVDKPNKTPKGGSSGVALGGAKPMPTKPSSTKPQVQDIPLKDPILQTTSVKKPKKPVKPVFDGTGGAKPMPTREVQGSSECEKRWKRIESVSRFSNDNERIRKKNAFMNKCEGNFAMPTPIIPNTNKTEVTLAKIPLNRQPVLKPSTNLQVL